ncbi:MAG TPA: carbohydrate ABC transporter permease [Candidatus Avoscillospira avicola]|uniref:Carbohydrate ABC transporter permease n=1 Tax=Candidatus Avoscillospira avicola TaxID=2840706 RepID=A0A9D1DI76_9FIRM|nr:carbohydrate ABC transporter permease [Candidatus Avoscillospira avicola]
MATIAVRKKRRRITAFDVALYIFFTLVAFVMLYPLWSVLIGSLMPYNEYVTNTLKLWAPNPTLESYKVFFGQEEFFKPLINSIIYTVGGTVLSMIVTTMAAYALSKKRLVGRNALMYIFFFTTLFTGGIIPVYITMKSYHLLDSLLSVILLTTVNTIYLIILRTHFMSIPADIEEAAMIDGANDFTTLFRIMLPMSKPILATLVLFYAVDKWNDFYNPLFLIRSEEHQVLQVILYNILFVGTQNPMKNQFTMISQSNVASETMRMAAVIAVTLPILLVYPFLQKHFVKGVMVGSIKG